MSIYYYISLLFVLDCVAILAIWNYNLVKDIKKYQEQLKVRENIINLKEESVLRLEKMLDVCVSSEIKTIAYLDNFKDLIPIETFQKFKEDSIKLATFKEQYLERWTEIDQAKAVGRIKNKKV